MVLGTESTSVNPAGAVNYTYTYDSVTGQFTEGTDSGGTGGGGNG